MSNARESLDFDVVIVGAGPAGLATAIRLKQRGLERGTVPTVAILEKGSAIGAHILSGAVIDPVGLDALIPDWRRTGAPLDTEVRQDRFYYLTRTTGIRIPHALMPPLMSNRGCHVGSLGALCRWLAQRAEELGVEIYPGFAAAEALYDGRGALIGVATGDAGVGRDGQPTARFTRGVELHGKYVVIAEGARGSLARELMRRFDLESGREPQKFGIGIKELWEVAPAQHHAGRIQHTLGWPLDDRTGGGSFLYHYGTRRVAVGFVVHLNYRNPYLSPFEEFQRVKTHRLIRTVLEGGTRIAYGARAITEGGWQSMPRLAFPGGLLAGCAAGLVNVPRIKGSHNAILSGIEAADAILAALGARRAHDVLEDYETAVRSGAIGRDLKRVRNAKPLLSKLGTVPGTLLAGVDMWINTIVPALGYTLGHGRPDAACLEQAQVSPVIDYPKADGVLTFDRLTDLAYSGTHHEENQPSHVKLIDPAIPLRVNLPVYAEPAQRYCPAGVFEIVRGADGSPRFQINAANCLHCKTCDIKDPSRNIVWTVPEGGGGPAYVDM